MMIILTMVWIRFSMYFLVIEPISKLLLTLYKMLGDAFAFISIVICFLMLMASIFTRLYQDNNPDRYGNLRASISTLFDAMVPVYSYAGMGNREASHNYLMMMVVSITSVIMLNFVIAILSTTY